MHADSINGMIIGMSEERMMPVQIKVLDVSDKGAKLSVNDGTYKWVPLGYIWDVPAPSAPAGGGESRWEAFSDEEVEAFLAMANQVDTSARPSARALISELAIEEKQRRGGYKGPGVYEEHTGRVYDVLGHVEEDEKIILRARGDGHLILESWILESWDSFNGKVDGVPAYRYLRALGD